MVAGRWIICCKTCWLILDWNCPSTRHIVQQQHTLECCTRMKSIIAAQSTVMLLRGEVALARVYLIDRCCQLYKAPILLQISVSPLADVFYVSPEIANRCIHVTPKLHLMILSSTMASTGIEIKCVCLTPKPHLTVTYSV